MTPEIEKRIKAVQAGRVPAGYKKSKVGIVPKDWGEVRFHDMFSRVVQKNKEGNTNVLTISAQYGLINQNDFFNKTVASDDKSNYYLMKKGEFAYNKSYSNGYPFGALKRLDFYDKGIVSPLYICFAANENNKCPDFYVHYFEAGLMNGEIQAFAQEGARNHGLLNISVDDFFNSNLLSPPIGEQKKIAEILATQDRVIELKEKLIAEKQSQKKYLQNEILFHKKKKNAILGDVSTLIATRSSDYLSHYVSTENMISNYGGVAFSGERKIIEGVSFCKEDILVANIRPYLKKAWIATIAGVCSADVLVLRAKKINPMYLYFVIASDDFVNYVMSGVKGTKMPRGDKRFILKKSIYVPSLLEQRKIAEVLSATDKEIELLKADLEQEKLKKKSLMQLLLTGLVRVA